MLSKKTCELNENTQRCEDCGIDAASMQKGKCRAPYTGSEEPFAYASIDLETTGLYKESCQIIQFGIVLDDLVSPIEELPACEWLVLQDDGIYTGQAFALQMNAKILKSIADVETGIKADHGNLPNYCYSYELSDTVQDWLEEQGWRGNPLLCAGKNFAAFDRQFLLELGLLWDIQMQHRSLDPVNLYYHPLEDWRQPPNMKTCCERAGIDSDVKHEALADAYMVIRLIREGYGICD